MSILTDPAQTNFAVCVLCQYLCSAISFIVVYSRGEGGGGRKINNIDFESSFCGITFTIIFEQSKSTLCVLVSNIAGNKHLWTNFENCSLHNEICALLAFCPKKVFSFHNDEQDRGGCCKVVGALCYMSKTFDESVHSFVICLGSVRPIIWMPSSTHRL